MAVHNPLAAKLAAGAGFDAIWGSGFELSASYAVPDANILAMGTHLDMMRAIGAMQDAPVIADLDTGFGNAVNVAYVVPQLTPRASPPSSSRTRPFPMTRVCGPAGGRSSSRSANFKARSPPPRRRAPCSSSPAPRR